MQEDGEGKAKRMGFQLEIDGGFSLYTLLAGLLSLFSLDFSALVACWWTE